MAMPVTAANEMTDFLELTDSVYQYSGYSKIYNVYQSDRMHKLCKLLTINKICLSYIKKI